MEPLKHLSLTPTQLNQIRAIVAKEVKSVVYHPDKFDFIDIIAQKIITTVDAWFGSCKGHGAKFFHYSNEYCYTETDVKMLKQVWKIFRVELNCTPTGPELTDNYWGSSACFIPPGLAWTRPTVDKKSRKYNVEFAWFLNHPYLCPQKQPAAVLPKTLAEEVYKKESPKLSNDVIVIASHDGIQTEFAANKEKLCCHSDKLRTLFEGGKFKEAFEHKLQIEAAPAIVKAMLDYIRTGELDNTLELEQVIALTKLAHENIVQSLLFACQQKLSEQLVQDPKTLKNIVPVAMELDLEPLLNNWLQNMEQDEKSAKVLRSFIAKDNLADLYERAQALTLPKVIDTLTVWAECNGMEISIDGGIPALEQIPD